MSRRTYVPATPALLAEWHAAGAVPAEAERVVAPGEDEESEYAALMGAADASLELLGGAGRRVVVVVEETVGPDRGDVPAPAAVAWRHVAAVHADAVERPAGADPDDDLAWYATQEVAQLLG